MASSPSPGHPGPGGPSAAATARRGAVAADPPGGDRPRAERILTAAIAEFTEHGLAGARVERIAQRAAVNKQLLYYYYGSKEGLFDAAIAAITERFRAINEQLPERIADRPRYYAEAAAQDRGIVRLLEWEALERGREPVVREEERRAYFADRVAELVDRQAAGELPADLDPAQLFLAFQALAAHPQAFPQMVRHITGMEVDDPAFLAARQRFLDALAAHLFAGADRSTAAER